MLLIAIAYGSRTDPFTTSTTLPGLDAAEAGLDPNNGNHMRDYIAKDKKLRPEDIDCVLVVYDGDDGEGPVVQHNHTEFD
jgi:hypothetical protein